MSPLYVYAVLGEPPAGPLPAGLAGERLRLVPCDGVLAAVGDLEAAPRLGAATLRAHDRTVRALAAGGAAILPARFGSLASDDQALRDSLRSRRAPLREALDAVRGCEQMTLRFWWSDEAAPPSVDAMAAPPATAHPSPPSVPRAAPGGPGTRFLVERRARSAAERTVPEVRRILDAVGAHTRSERVEWHDRPPLVASAYHLVPRETIAAYRAGVDEAAAGEPRLRVSASGPWPPYAFAPDEWA